MSAAAKIAARRVAAAAVLGLAASMLALAPAVPNAAAASASLPTAAGGTVCARLTSVRVDADGDTHHVFQFANGMSTDEVIPAPSLNAATSTPARLKKFGLPPRPAAGSAGRATWNKLVEGVKLARRVQAPCVDVGVRADFPTHRSGIWAGYVAHAATGKSFSGAHTSYTAPSYFLSSCSQETMTQWVGVFGGSVLAQAGLLVNENSSPLIMGGFLEFVGGSWDTGSVVMLPQVQYVPGHRYYFSVQYEDRFDWGITVEDLDNPANSYSQSWHPGQAGATQYIQPEAAVISERLTIGEATQYMNHSTVSFRTTTAHINGEGDARFSIEGPQRWDMSSNVGVPMASVGPLDTSTSNFTENWASCGIAEVPNK